MKEFSISRPFDAHVHGREGALLKKIGPMTARQFWGAIFEPNLAQPVTTAARGKEYLREICEACGSHFQPYLLAYLTDEIDPEDLLAGIDEKTFIGMKFYPRGATTNSHNGVADVRSLFTRGTRPYEAIQVCAAAGKVVQLHCELNFSLNGDELDPYHKEAYFFREIMPRLRDEHPDARFSCEHISCLEAVSFMRRYGGEKLGCSITPHHLLHDRRDMFRGGLHPHLYCLPVIKSQRHNASLCRFIAKGYPFVYAGTDSAPHDRHKKECDCCSGGVFTAHTAVELYAEAFARAHALDYRFERFMSFNGPAFYDLEPSGERITLVPKEWTEGHLIHYSADRQDVIVPYGYDKDPAKRHRFLWKTHA